MENLRASFSITKDENNKVYLTLTTHFYLFDILVKQKSQECSSRVEGEQLQLATWWRVEFI